MLNTLTLHQLHVLLAVLEESSVTRAAKRLRISQPALSHALRGLRESLGDAILVPGQGGMVLTARAASLLPTLSRLLRELETALSGDGGAEPLGWRRRFTIACWDGFLLGVLPALLAKIGAEAPQIDLDIRPVPPGGCAAELQDGRYDLAIEVRPGDAPGLKMRALAEDGFACLVRADHPGVGATLDLDTFVRLSHALISPQGEGMSIVDRKLGERGLSRRVALRIRYFLAAPLVVAHSDLVLTAPRDMCLRMAAMAPLRVLEPPLELGRFRTSMVWHERVEDDAAHRWLRGAVAGVV